MSIIDFRRKHRHQSSHQSKSDWTNTEQPQCQRKQRHHCVAIKSHRSMMMKPMNTLKNSYRFAFAINQSQCLPFIQSTLLTKRKHVFHILTLVFYSFFFFFYLFVISSMFFVKFSNALFSTTFILNISLRHPSYNSSAKTWTNHSISYYSLLM